MSTSLHQRKEQDAIQNKPSLDEQSIEITNKDRRAVEINYVKRLFKRFLLFTLVFLLLIYLSVPLILARYQDKALFLGSDAPLIYNMLKGQEISIVRDDLKLQGWFIDKPITDENPLIIFYGGSGQDVSFISLVFNYLTDNAVLTFNYRGYGLSEGKSSEQSIYEDAHYIFRSFLESKKISPSNVVLVSASMGSPVASYIASKEEVKGLIYVVPIDSITEVAKSHLSFYPGFVIENLIRHRLDNVKLVSQVNERAIMIIAEQDGIVHRENSERIFKAYPGPKELVIIKDAGHMSILNSEELYLQVNEFIADL